ncbi:MAG: VWA domain-containing protein [Silvibacterium sp.]|nr:VWA domain-containing protein [Silvibacterium sp.]
MNRSTAVFAGCLLCGYGLAAQATPQSESQAPKQSSPTTIQSTAQEVVLDMVFRDKNGKTVRDIKPEQVHVFEDGIEQHLTSFGLVEGQAAAPANPSESMSGASGKPLTLDPMRELRLVTLVFEGLDNDGKRFFRQALDDLLKMAPEQNLYFSVFTIDQKLHCLQPFTDDHAALLKTVDKATMWSFIQYSKQSEQIKTQLANTLSQGESDAQSSATGDTAQPPPGGPTAGAGQAAWQMAKIQYDMLQQADAADREYGARATIDALLAIVRAESRLPGRKVVLYFNPWLFIPEIAKEQYNYMISAANRGNVSFYTVDPKGLVTYSQDDQGRRDLGGALGELRQQQLSGGVGEVRPSQARMDETAENAIRSNPLLWLRDLAGQTGGVTIAETNDLRAPLRTVMDEVRTYYEASYNPHIATYDGKFRKISVKVDRPGIAVLTRSGYFAVPQLKGGQQLYAYEVPLLSALSSQPPPADVFLKAAAERFSERGPKIEYVVTLEAPLSALTFKTQPDGKTAVVDAAMLAVVRNSTGEIIEKFSKDLAVQVSQDQVNDRKKSNLIQTFPTRLPPGTYSLEAAITDRNNGKVGVKKSTLMVPPTSNKLAISDVVVVRRSDQLKDNQILDPFYFPGGKVVPTLSTTLKGGPGNVLPFYFAVYPDPTIKDAPQLTMAFYKDGQYLGSAHAPPLPAPGQDGRIPYPVSLPADKFTPGSYQIRMDVTQGSASAEGNVDFQVE